MMREPVKDGKNVLAELADLLREEAAVCETCMKSCRNLREILLKNSSGKGALDASMKLEPGLTHLHTLEKSHVALLAAAGEPNALYLIAHQPATEARSTAARLYKEASQRQEALKKELGRTAQALKKSKEFVDFNMNILTQVQVDGTYAKDGEDPQGAQRQKLFEANV